MAEEEKDVKPAKTEPTSADVVNDKTLKRLRAAEEKAANAEKALQDQTTELDELRKLTKKASELPPVNPTTERKTLLDELNDLVFGPCIHTPPEN
jgi:thiamine biosynthesis lipoprotein ApbE